MARKLIVEIVGDDDSLHRAFTRSARESQNFGRNVERASRGAVVATVGFRGLGRSVAFASGAFLGGAGLVAAGKAAIGSASDLNEEINKADVVFGKSARSVQAWSKTTSDAMGIARAQALEAAGGFGAILETSGLAEGQAAKFSTRLVKLASDIASFNNIDPSQALEKLRSGLVGEAEPLRTVGVLLSEARVKAEAYRLGLAKQGATLTEAQKVQARYSLILKDTARQQGDFARTSDGLANASRRVRAELTDAAASIGTLVLPAIADAADSFADFLGDLQRARGARAKLNVVIDAGRSIAEQGRKIGAQILEETAAVLRRVDWGEVGREISRGIASSLDAAAAALREVDWGQVGRVIVRGIIAFLRGVDWVALIKGVMRLTVAALKASRDLLRGAAIELGKAILAGLKAGANEALLFVEKWALELVKKVVGAFSFLGRFDPFKGLQDSVQKRLDAVQKRIDELHGKDVDVNVRVNVGTGQTRGVGVPSGTGAGDAGAAVQNEVETESDRQTNAANAAAKARRLAASKAKAAAARAQKAKEDAVNAFNSLLDSLDLKLERAEAAGRIKRQIAVQKEIQQAILDEIKVEGRTTELLRKLFESRQAVTQLQAQQRQQAQFSALGLTSEGERRLPSSRLLLKRVGTLRQQIKGTVLDTAKTRAELDAITRVLKGAFGKVGREVRQAIVQMLSDIASGLKGGTGDRKGPLTKFRVTNTSELLSGLGLSVEQEQALRRRISRTGAGGTTPRTTTTGGAFGAEAGTGTRTTNNGVIINGPVTVVANDPEEFQRRLDRKAQRTTKSRTGPASGRNL